MSVKRDSGTEDVIHISYFPFGIHLVAGDLVSVSGLIRTRARTPDSPGLFLWANGVARSRGAENTNHVELRGIIQKTPVHRLTPLGKKITDVLLYVPGNKGRFSLVPLVFWDALSEEAALIPADTWISIVGRLQSRRYDKRYDDGTIVNNTVYEVSVATLIAGEPYLSSNVPAKEAM
jgi:hypothetical protein